MRARGDARSGPAGLDRVSSGKKAAMSTLHRLKAYFGMVPAEELDEEAAWYAAEDGYGSRGEGGAYGRYEPRYREESEGPGQPAGLRQPHRAWASEPPVASSTREPTVLSLIHI